MEELEKLKKQHLFNYKKAILEIIINNTKGLIDDDIMSLFKAPPLDSMDLIKSKFLFLAKKEKIILNTENLNKIINMYRDKICNCLDIFKKIRIESLNLKVDDFVPVKDYDVFKLTKKDLSIIDKKLKKQLKELVNEQITKNLINNMDCIFNSGVDSSVMDLIIRDSCKYLKKDYIKQLFENIDVKIIVKNTILINGIKEQGERYIFTNEHSRLLNVN